ncbi:MAG: YhjD/YihY/BrkB family envelope integrity protein [Pseudohongiellaceae bacterium]
MPPYKSKLVSLHDQVNSLLWGQSLTSASLLKRTIVRSGQILYAIGRDLGEGQLSLRAMSLVYSTILGFIPMIALIFAVLKSLGVHNAMEPTLLTLLEGLGDRRVDITAQIITFVDNIRVEIIGITSLGLLIYLVLDMMRKIESSFNYIWSVSRGRSWSNRVSEYLFAVIVSPVLIFISISITSSVNTMLFARFLDNLSFGSGLISAVAFVLPLLFMSLAFAFAYSFLPNTRVNFSSAFIGGVVTTAIWKLMGALFQDFFISAARESIYLAFATVIAIMIFTYIGWLVALLGSDIAYYHQYPSRCRAGRNAVPLSIVQKETLALLVAAIVIRRFLAGKPSLSADELAARLGIGTTSIDDTLASLQSIGLLARTAGEPARYLPQTAVNDYRITDLWTALRQSTPAPFPGNLDLTEARLVNNFMSQLDAVAQRELGNITFNNGND